jgi:hypothetical protein
MNSDSARLFSTGDELFDLFFHSFVFFFNCKLIRSVHRALLVPESTWRNPLISPRWHAGEFPIFFGGFFLEQFILQSGSG